MEVRAHLRHLRITPRKVRLVIDLIRGMHVDRAAEQLAVLPKRSTTPVLKLLNSAIANAEHNFHLDRKTLVIKSIVANEGPKLKRYRPRAFGRAAEILHRSSHVSIVLEGSAPANAKKVEAPKVAAPDKVALKDVKEAPAKPKISRAKKTTIKADPAAAEKAHDAKDSSTVRQGEE